jgi:hypothetical protein
MASMDFYPKAAMERAMKVQEVILRALAKKITWWHKECKAALQQFRLRECSDIRPRN